MPYLSTLAAVQGAIIIKSLQWDLWKQQACVSSTSMALQWHIKQCLFSFENNLFVNSLNIIRCPFLISIAWEQDESFNR